MEKVEAPSQARCEILGGVEFHWLNNRLHRESAPAVTWPTGDYTWFKHGLVHRTCGPAIRRTHQWPQNAHTPAPTIEHGWYLEDQPLTFEDWCAATGKTQEQKLFLILAYP